MPEPFRLHRSTRSVDQRKHIFSASVTAHLISCRTVDIARESADLILLEKSLMVLEAGVVEGRKVFANILKYVRMGASSNKNCWNTSTPEAAAHSTRLCQTGWFVESLLTQTVKMLLLRKLWI